MSLGERATLIIDNSYAYGDSAMGDSIPPNSDLVFDLELLRINENKLLSPSNMQNFRGRLEAWKKKKLFKYDSNKKFRKLRNKKYGGRDGYLKFLDSEIDKSISEVAPYLDNRNSGHATSTSPEILRARSYDGTLDANYEKGELNLLDAQSGIVLISKKIDDNLLPVKTMRFETKTYELAFEAECGTFSVDLTTKEIVRKKITRSKVEEPEPLSAIDSNGMSLNRNPKFNEMNYWNMEIQYDDLPDL
mmetsp:Transcript_28816/g.70279  ORF Transcript_28816/g.70279 Transcript_28816/m.70279 type:complete len:247 (+) Transcript_28816:296-1036(+)